MQIEELGARETCEGSNAVPVEQRVRDLADENASLNRYNRELKEEYDVLQKELAENSALVLDVKPSTNECSKSFQEIVNEKDVEISSLKEKIEHLTQKLSKRRRRASYHSSEHFTALSVQTYSNVESNPNLISLLNELETKVGMQEKECEFKEAQNIINQMKNNLMQEDDKSELKADKRISQFEDGVLLVESEDSRVIEGLKARNSQLVHEIKDLKRELEGKCSIIGDVEVKSAEITGFLGVDLGEKGPNSLPGKNSELKKKIEVLEGELKVSSESNKMLEEKLNKATTASEELKQEYQNKVDSLRKDLHEQLERHKCDMDEKLFQINELEMKLKEDLTTQELSLCERDIDSDQFEERSSHMLEMAATLERKSKTINKLQEQLHEVLSSRDTLVSEHEAYVASLQDKTNKELEERDTTIEEKCRTIEEMRKQLQQALSRNEALVEDYESHITRLQHEFRAELLMNTTSLEEKSRVLNELGEKMQRTLSSKETLPVGRENGECASVGFTGIPFEEAETQIASQKDEASSLDDLNDQLSSLTSGKCDFSTELETNDFEIEEKSNFIAEPREQLKQAISTGEDAKLEKLKTKKVVKFKEPLQEDTLREETISKEEAILKTEELILILRERGRKYTEVEGKVTDVDKMKEVVEPTTYHCESSLRDPGNQGCVVDLKNELNKDLEKKSKELEEILRENAKLRKQLDHTLSGGQVSLQEHEEHIANLRRNFDEELERKNKELQAKSNEIDRLNERLEQELIENESANVKHDFAYIQTALEDGLEKNTRKREETSETVNQLEDPLKTISSKQQSPDYHERLVAALVMEFRKELDRENVKLGNGIAVLQEELQQAISSEEAMPNDWKDYIDRPHEKFDKDLEKRKSEVEENQSRCNNFEEKLKEAIWSEQVMVEDNETYIAGLIEFGEELHGIHSTAEEKFNLVRELERKLQDAIAGNDLLKENVNQLASLRKELDKVLQVKNDVIAEKSALITNLHEQIENLMTAKKELVDHHETYITSLREEFNEEFERINGILTDKSTLCSNLEDEIKKTKSDQDALLSDHEALVTELKRELNEELERSKAIAEEKSTMVLKLEERIINKETEYEESILNNEGLRRKIEALDLEAQKITADLEQKTSQISNLDSELAKTMEAKDTLAEERVSLLSKCQTLEKELSKIRLEFETQSDNLLALEKKANDADRAIHALSQENDSKLDDLSKKNKRLKEECQRLEGQVQELSEQKVEVVEKDERIAQLTKDIEQLTKESVSVSQGKMSCENCFGNGNERKKRESLLFKMMLEDIKEHVSCGKGDVNQVSKVSDL